MQSAALATKKSPLKRRYGWRGGSKKTECVAWISGGRIMAGSIMALVHSLLLMKTY